MLKGEARKAYEKYFMPIGEENMRKRREGHRTMKVGDKYIIEIGEVIPSTMEMNLPFPEVENNKRYLAKIKGFNSLVFDENGLEKLEKLEETEQKERMEKYIKTLHELNETLKKSLEKNRESIDAAEHRKYWNDQTRRTNEGYETAQVVRCRNCRCWEEEIPGSSLRYCNKSRLIYDARPYDVEVKERTDEDYFCADGEVRGEDE